jgi:hypothetical protein
MDETGVAGIVTRKAIPGHLSGYGTLCREFTRAQFASLCSIQVQ